MQFRSIAASVLLSVSAFAFQDTSPFFAISSSETDLSSIKQRNVATSDQLLSDLRLDQDQTATLADVYILISQPGVSTDDFRNADAAAHLRRRISGDDASVKSSTVVSEVVEDLSIESIEQILRAKHNFPAPSRADIGSGLIESSDDVPYILRVNLPAPAASGAQRAVKLAEHDSFINAILDTLPTTYTYTLFYTTTTSTPTQQRHVSAPLNEKNFEWETEDSLPSSLHIDLKRDVAAHLRKRDNVTLNDAPLFERYNFLSAGMYMGLLVTIVLFSIGSVGVKALGSLQVSYGAFTKEMGAQAQKKVQQ